MVYFLDLLEPGQDVAGFQRNLNGYSLLTRDALLFLWDISTSTQPASYAEKKEYPAVVMMLTRHVCEHLDAVTVLAAQGCAEPGKLSLRSAFEATLCIQYILAKDSNQRGLSYIVAHTHRKIDLYDKLDPAKRAPATRYIDGLKSMLKRPEYVPIEAEWQARKGKANWFSLFKGPASVKQLADQMGQSDLYDWFYRNYSNTMHATDGLDKLAKGNAATGEKAIKPLRHPEGLEGLVCFAVDLVHLVWCLLYDRWGTPEQKATSQAEYEAKIRPRLLELRGKSLIKAAWR